MTLSIHSPDELMAAIPHLLGSQPEESIVFLPMRSELPVARVDLPTTPRDREMVWRAIGDPYSRHARPGSSIAIVCLCADRDNAEVVGHDFAARNPSESTHASLADDTGWADLDTIPRPRKRSMKTTTKTLRMARIELRTTASELRTKKQPRMTWKVASGRYNPSMRSKDALRALAEITAYQWGMVTSAQASMHGVTRLDLSRLAADGLLERLAHGVYKTTGTPSDGLDRLRAAWLSTAPKSLAHVRRTTDPDAVVLAGASAALIHGIGDLWDEHFDFITPVRRQSQRDQVRYRKRHLDPRDVTTVDGLPVLTVAATIADLVEMVGDLSLVADALRDAWRRGDLDTARLTELLGPVTLTRLTELAGIGQAIAHG